MSGPLVARAIGRAVREAATGAVEWHHEKRRRLFFFRAGALVLVQSNLKSESPERVAERDPALTPALLAETVAALRVREALGETRGDVTFHAGAPAPAFEPLDAHALLWAATDRLPALPHDARPCAVPIYAPLLARIPAGAEVVRYLLELDGSRELDDVLEFGPESPELIGRALAVAAVLGAVDLAAPASRGSAPPPIAAPPIAPSATAPPAAAPSVTAPSVTAPPAAAPPFAATAPFAAPPPTAAPPFAATAAPALTTDDIAGFIHGALGAPDRPAMATPVVVTPAHGPARDESAGLFGGASATVSLGGRGAPAAPEAPALDPEAALHARFGPALTRIRGATDHFAVLGTSWPDAPDTHRRAYFALAQRLHPDQFVGESDAIKNAAAVLFNRVREAWETLGDDARREAYIAREIRGEKTEQERAMEKVRLILEAEADFKRGVGELQAGRVSAAHEHFVRAAAAVPDEIEFGAHAAYTSFRIAHGRDEMAANDAARRLAIAVQANERLDGVWVLHGIVLRMTGDDAGARQAFVTALKLRPTNPDAVREMRRLEREKTTVPETGGGGGGLFSKLFPKKK